MAEKKKAAPLVSQRAASRGGWRRRVQRPQKLDGTPDEIIAEAFAPVATRVSDSAAITNNMPARRFPPPWTVEGLDACFVVRDGNGQQVAYTVMRVTGSRNKRFPVRLNSPFFDLSQSFDRSTNSK
jgi:hypothetical protein